MKFSSWLVNNSTPVSRDWVMRIAKSADPELHAYLVSVERVKLFSLERCAIGDYDGAHQFKLKRREYEQASIKLKRERDRRKRVYNLY